MANEKPGTSAGVSRDHIDGRVITGSDLQVAGAASAAEPSSNDTGSGVSKPDIGQRVSESVLYKVIRELKCEISDLQEENARLRGKVSDLQEENARLRDRVASLKRHTRMAIGIQGETIISKIVGYLRTTGNKSHDLEGFDPEGKQRLMEVKFSNILTPTRDAKRWQWNAIRGRKGDKVYDRLILVGDTDGIDDKYKEFYRDKKSPYIIFDIPFGDLETVFQHEDLFNDGGTGSEEMIQLNINRHARNKKTERLRRLLYDKYQVTETEMESIYKKSK